MAEQHQQQSSSSSSSSGSSGWGNALPEALSEVLDKLFHVSDCIRFGTVCESWRKATANHKQKRIQNLDKQPPMSLLIPHPDDYYAYASTGFFKLNGVESKLYNVGEDRLYKVNLERLILGEEAVAEATVEVRILGSSHGWLAVQKRDDQESFILCNPFNRKRLEIQGTPKGLGKVHKIVLSCDPSLNPDNLVVAALLSGREGGPIGGPERVMIKSGQEPWVSVDTVMMGEEAFGVYPSYVADILFHQGFLYAVDPYGCLIAVDCSGGGETGSSDGGVPAVGVVLQRRPIKRSQPDRNVLAASSTGILLLMVPAPYVFGEYDTYRLVKHKRTGEGGAGEAEETAAWEKGSPNPDETILVGMNDACLCIQNFDPDWSHRQASTVELGFNGRKDIQELAMFSPPFYWK
ncbi:OLC1v1024051C1 [Oldenlandia corymbosa var. corymbosa]|uniref:OLC1v1024051C1 n=1 Tax=Oldenlandia corymbosa var. corymbosa TaxID=529605 RepID=A0AAV1C1E4_OLDCO|nr:OLC1v1024051C1 [Oldenlandia corymbosa var. corymbosa]